MSSPADMPQQSSPTTHPTGWAVGLRSRLCETFERLTFDVSSSTAHRRVTMSAEQGKTRIRLTPEAAVELGEQLTLEGRRVLAAEPPRVLPVTGHEHIGAEQ